MASVLDLRNTEPKLNPKKRWVPVPRTTPQPLTAGHSAYLRVHALLPPDTAIGYGITRGGPWARVGDARARAKTPEAALEEAYRLHMESTDG